MVAGCEQRSSRETDEKHSFHTFLLVDSEIGSANLTRASFPRQIVVVNLMQMERLDSTSPLSDPSKPTHADEQISRHATVGGEAAALLSDPQRAVYLYPFIGRERSASEVVRELDIKLGTLLYQIKCLCRAGLLRVTRSEKRGGSSIKYYRATADAIFVPLEFSDAESIEALLNRWNQSLQNVYLRGFATALKAVAPRWGVRISRDANGRLMIAPANSSEKDWDFFAPESPVLLEGWFTDLRLNLADAKRLQADLIELYSKYLGREGAQRYIIKVAHGGCERVEPPLARRFPPAGLIQPSRDLVC